ncbi:hypothetical protein A3Q56_08718, partial [Intoshia linei]
GVYLSVNNDDIINADNNVEIENSNISLVIVSFINSKKNMKTKLWTIAYPNRLTTVKVLVTAVDQKNFGVPKLMANWSLAIIVNKVVEKFIDYYCVYNWADCVPSSDSTGIKVTGGEPSTWLRKCDPAKLGKLDRALYEMIFKAEYDLYLKVYALRITLIDIDNFCII